MMRMLGTDSLIAAPFARLGLPPAAAAASVMPEASELVKPAVSFMVSLPGTSISASLAAALRVRNQVPAKTAVYAPFRTVSMR